MKPLHNLAQSSLEQHFKNISAKFSGVEHSRARTRTTELGQRQPDVTDQKQRQK